VLETKTKSGFHLAFITVNILSDNDQSALMMKQSWLIGQNQTAKTSRRRCMCSLLKMESNLDDQTG